LEKQKRMIKTNYIYLLIEREFISLQHRVFKIGRTEQEHNKRMCGYPKGSILIFQMLCNDCVKLEADLLRQFKIKYKHRDDIGNEYFEGNCELMVKDIYEKVFASFQNIRFFQQKEIPRQKEPSEIEFVFQGDDEDEFIQKYIDEICITQKEYNDLNLPKKKMRIKASDLFDAFTEETKNQVDRIKKQDFYKRVEDLGFRKYKSDGTDCFEGIDLKRKYIRSEVPSVCDDDNDVIMDDENTTLLPQLIMVNEMLRILKIIHPHDEGAIVCKIFLDDFEVHYTENRQKYLSVFNEVLTGDEKNILEVVNVLLSLCGAFHLVQTTLTKYKLTSDIDVVNDQLANLGWYDEIQKYRYK